ncbi:cytochrome P450 [Amycolatopsis sp. GM8]|uniref:cytochrome P450 n=1 Tax=Amycolatopsis sp. GM8 TaxID=2896530 RepID=UPI001F27E35D|nr:cytochrome P450 [Amycolatopsis sp. GM8]
MSVDQSDRPGPETGIEGWSCYTATPARSMALFEETRARRPVAHSDEHDGFHVLVRYDDVKEATADHETYSSEPQVLRPMLPRKPIPALEMDPPRHRTWRALFNNAVKPRTIRELEPLVRADIGRHIDSFIEDGHTDLVTSLAEPVPAEAICRLVGIDDELVPEIRELALAMFAAQGDPEEFGRRQAQFGAVTVREVHKRRAEPRDDYLTELGQADVEGRRLDDDDLVVLLAAFLGAGHHSTTSAMSSLIREVFSAPDILAGVRRDPAKIPAAVEEALRLRPPFYGFFRRAAKPVTVAEVAVGTGDDVYLGWAAANRDPAMFADPGEFRLDRDRNRHLSFGHGVHVCPGAPLARMELRVALEELLRRTPDLRIELAEPVYEFGGGDYAFLPALPVSFTPGTRLP